jgi:LAGLIDADG endonuclease
VSPPAHMLPAMANPWPEQYAGSQRGSVDLPSYISGYVDGEGCFTVSISPRPTLVVGWEVRPSVSVSQNGDRSEVLFEIQRYFGCGTVRPDRSDRTLKCEVRSLPLILDRVIPHFRRHPLLSGKQMDFELFAEICERMNPSGKRRFQPETILRSLVEMKA